MAAQPFQELRNSLHSVVDAMRDFLTNIRVPELPNDADVDENESTDDGAHDDYLTWMRFLQKKFYSTAAGCTVPLPLLTESFTRLIIALLLLSSLLLSTYYSILVFCPFFISLRSMFVSTLRCTSLRPFHVAIPSSINLLFSFRWNRCIQF